MSSSPPEVETVVINGFTFSYRKRFFPGHVCTVAEANVLNQQLKKNLRRNFAVSVPLLANGGIVREEIATQIIQAFREYESTYTFGGPDPVLGEAEIIALEVVKRTLKADGKLISDFTMAALRDLADDVLKGPHGHVILAQARQRVIIIQQAAAKEIRREESDGGE
jgi:hypothetical protein